MRSRAGEDGLETPATTATPAIQPIDISAFTPVSDGPDDSEYDLIL